MVNQTDAAAADAPPETPPADATPPPANPVFKSLMGGVAYAVLIFAVLSLASLFVMAVMQSFGPPLPSMLLVNLEAIPERKLYWPWSAFVWLVASGGVLAKIVASLVAILTVGVGVIAETTRSRWLALSIICLCLAGTILSVLLMWQLSGETALAELRSPTNLDDAQFLAALNRLLVALALWFLAFLGRQIGIDGFKDIMAMIKQWVGGGR